MSVFDIKKLLQSVVTHDASDLHLVSRTEPKIRIDGILKTVNLPKLSGETIKEMCYTLIDEKQKKYFETHGELDFAIYLPNIGRFRINYYRTLGETAASFRVIPLEVPSLEDLKSPKIYKELLQREKGLILVTGPTGSGKSTTLASMLNEINLTKSKHIITIEDPVEFIHQHKKCIFSQRNIGEDTDSFATALKYAMRQDPDIILIGEMRDKETIEATLTAAETGHLVFATLHTASAPETINRIIDSFKGEEQSQIRAMLSTSLVAIIAQALLPKLGGGRVVTSEILIMNHAIANLIRDNKVHQIYSQMQLGQENSHMQTQTQALLKYLQSGQISRDTALQFANKPDEIIKTIL